MQAYTSPQPKLAPPSRGNLAAHNQMKERAHRRFLKSPAPTAPSRHERIRERACHPKHFSQLLLLLLSTWTAPCLRKPSETISTPFVDPHMLLDILLLWPAQSDYQEDLKRRKNSVNNPCHSVNNPCHDHARYGFSPSSGPADHFRRRSGGSKWPSTTSFSL